MDTLNLNLGEFFRYNERDYRSPKIYIQDDIFWCADHTVAIIAKHNIEEEEFLKEYNNKAIMLEGYKKYMYKCRNKKDYLKHGLKDYLVNDIVIPNLKILVQKCTPDNVYKYETEVFTVKKCITAVFDENLYGFRRTLFYNKDKNDVYHNAILTPFTLSKEPIKDIIILVSDMVIDKSNRDEEVSLKGTFDMLESIRNINSI